MRAARSWAMPDIRPNITPLIGVLFVLMAVFMAAAPPATTSVTVEQSGTEVCSCAPQQPAILISIINSDLLYLDHKPVPRSDLDTRIDAAATSLQSRHILIRSDANIPYGAFFGVVDQLKKLGYHVAILTEDME